MNKDKKFKKVLSGILAVTMLFGIVPFSVCFGEGSGMLLAAQALEVDEGIKIDKAYLKAGESLKILNAGDCTIKYYVDGQEAEDEEFILKEEYYEKWIKAEAYNGDELVSSDSAFFSKLPVVYVNTEDGSAITSKEEYKSCDLCIQNNTESKQIYWGEAKIKGRGNSSWKWPKKPYRIKLDKKTDLFGMGKNKNWVLLANYLDESLLRNTTAFQISEELGLTTIKTVWTDVVINGEYVGNYQLCEQIRVDEGRVDIFDWESEAEEVASAVYKKEMKSGNELDKDALEEHLKTDLSWISTGVFTFNETDYTVSDYYEACRDISGGYLFELSNEYDELSKFTTESGLKVMIKSPEYLYTNSDMMDYVSTYWQNFENAYKSEDGYVDTADGSKHYSELADIDSMVSFWLVMEIMGNSDATRKSRYAYLDHGGVITFGPVWDFDWGGASSGTSHQNPRSWTVSKNNNSQAFYKEFLDDPLFIAKATEKYWEIRPFLERLIEEGGILDTEIAYLSESGAADEAAWDRTVTWPTKARGFENDAEIFRSFLSERIIWMDNQFKTDGNLMKGTYTDYSAKPYNKSDLLKIRIDGAMKDFISEKAPAVSLTESGSNVSASVNVYQEAAESVDFYVNGIFCGNSSVKSGLATCVIASDKLNPVLGKKNVISIVGRNAGGESTGRNFITVIQAIRGDEPDVVLGDVNIDGLNDVRDVTALQRKVADYEDLSDAQLAAADVTSDGDISISDVTELQTYLAEFDGANEKIGVETFECWNGRYYSKELIN